MPFLPKFLKTSTFDDPAFKESSREFSNSTERASSAERAAAESKTATTKEAVKTEKSAEANAAIAVPDSVVKNETGKGLNDTAKVEDFNNKISDQVKSGKKLSESVSDLKTAEKTLDTLDLKNLKDIQSDAYNSSKSTLLKFDPKLEKLFDEHEVNVKKLDELLAADPPNPDAIDKAKSDVETSGKKLTDGLDNSKGLKDAVEGKGQDFNTLKTLMKYGALASLFGLMFLVSVEMSGCYMVTQGVKTKLTGCGSYYLTDPDSCGCGTKTPEITTTVYTNPNCTTLASTDGKNPYCLGISDTTQSKCTAPLKLLKLDNSAMTLSFLPQCTSDPNITDLWTAEGKLIKDDRISPDDYRYSITEKFFIENDQLTDEEIAKREEKLKKRLDELENKLRKK